MTISYPLDLPGNPSAPARIVIGALDVVGQSQSPFTLASQVHRHQGQMWTATVVLPGMLRDTAEPWIAFLLALRGRFGTFRMGDPTRESPRGAGGGTPVVDGAGQTGETLAVTGAPLSITGWLKAGDYIQVGDYLHRTLTDTDTDGSGDATLDIWPRLRVSPSNGATVTLSRPTGLWRLAENLREFEAEPGIVYNGISFRAIEAL